MRIYLQPAGTNPHGLQNVGFSYAIEPALKAIYPDEKDFLKARTRYSARFNCHPFFAPMALGLYIRLEEDLARGKVPLQLFMNIKDSTANSLSAMGDALFSGSMLAAWALISSSLILLGYIKVAVVFTLALFLLLQFFKFFVFISAWRMGLKILTELGKLRLMRLAEKTKYLNAILLALMVSFIPDIEASKIIWFMLPLFLAFLLAGRYFVSRWLTTVGIFIVTLFILEYAPGFDHVLQCITSLWSI